MKPAGSWQGHPCKPDCRKRRAACHAHCPEYRAYEAERLKRYDQEDRARKANAYSAAEERRARDYATRGKKARRRNGTEG